MDVGDGAKLCANALESKKVASMAGVGVSAWSTNLQIPAEYLTPRWYALYTCANHEKRVAEQLGQRSVEHFLPLYAVVRRWKDRRVCLQMPLFPGYMFVRLALREKLMVLEVPGAVCLVSMQGRPAPLDDEEIDTLQHALASPFQAQPHPYLAAGLRVRIVRGPLTGCEGVLLRRKGNYRVALSVRLIQRSIAVDVDLADIAPHPRQIARTAEANR